MEAVKVWCERSCAVRRQGIEIRKRGGDKKGGGRRD